MKIMRLVLMLLLFTLVLYGCDQPTNDVGEVKVYTELGEFVGIIESESFMVEIKLEGEIIKFDTTSMIWGEIKELEKGEKVKVTFSVPQNFAGHHFLEKIEPI
ncbi:hypothetical protein [Planococcus salinus]|uniref:DUF3221 domain-containing protein n=1 Tax=Planococcus salinus TaxID=1848460 RepID=A0A3M8PBY5_9BACL|nr:hypothetical protein [Planococcus salinus]RNF41219.1 hypothetical protein EEX84_02410 [Planococcus salinus]